jgi:hypothetical protein
MLSKEAFGQWFQAQVAARWDKCSFNAVQLADWYWRLKAFDTAALTEAARRHHAADEPRRPSLKAIHDYARAEQARTAPPAREPAGVPEAHTYIQCVSTDVEGRGLVGWFVPVLLWPFRREYTADDYQRAAEQQADLHRRSRGGVWEVVTGTTHHAMNIRRWKLTGQWDRIRQQAAQWQRKTNPR